MANQLSIHNVKSIREEYTTLSVLNCAVRRIIITDSDDKDFTVVFFGCNGSRLDLQTKKVDQT